jgi:ABC-type dipeptide/oligopeptide/nickel transport system ATPase component
MGWLHEPAGTAATSAAYNDNAGSVAAALHRCVSTEEARRIAIDLLDDVGIPMPEARLKAYS